MTDLRLGVNALFYLPGEVGGSETYLLETLRALARRPDPPALVLFSNAENDAWLRAEPVATLYEQGRVRHAGGFAALEDEMCDFALTGLSSGRSPDRLDALVWAVTSLALVSRAQPRVRGL